MLRGRKSKGEQVLFLVCGYALIRCRYEVSEIQILV
uniref:Uncharacterized protein n=1 Tax=Ralstonia solanacearum TaxID=305 RepID=A0A0S4W8U6_RALSL|nr:protein of unknown function [Ralstonia solanacearum]